MARRADWDNGDEDFEILNEITPMKLPEKIVFIDDSFEIVPSKNNPLLLINTNPIPHVTIIEKPVPQPIIIDKPVINEVKQSLENSSPLPSNSTCLPARYGSAAIIPHAQGFDLQSILTRKPTLPTQTNELIDMLQNEKPKKCPMPENNLQQMLLDNNHDRRNLVQIAKQAQEDFLSAIYLD